MKYLISIFFLLTIASGFAQSRDTVYVDSSKNLVLKDGGLKKNEVLIFIDNVAYNGLLKDIDPHAIKSVDVLKGKDAIEIYGETAKNGAILITTNKTENLGYRNIVSVQKDTLQIDRKKRLIVMDGFIYEGKLADINPKDILRVDSLGNPGATSIYGEQGRYGVLLMMTYNEARWIYKHELCNNSTAYKMYLKTNDNDDSGLVYVVNGIVLDGSTSETIEKLYHTIGAVKTAYLIEARSEKPNLNNPKPLMVITTN